jgi:4-hydroxy-2,2'-bipyrrole-5-carbaldehyde O-methyltransferase
MRFRTAARVLASGQLGALLSLQRALPPYYRVSFLGAAASCGLLRRLAAGPLPLERLADGMVADAGPTEGLAAWLDFGVALGVLRHETAGYALRGRLARALAGADADAIAALVEEAGALHHQWITAAPARLRDARPFSLHDLPGDLIARSSRTVEPFVREAVEDIVPARGLVRLFEIGCGTGIHVRHAADRNPELTAVGIDLAADVVATARENIRRWGLAARVHIELSDVRERPATGDCDIATLHNNIYYFPVAERASLLSHVRDFLRPGGSLLVTTACRGGSVMTEILNLWGALTAGCGRLPDRDEMTAQLRAAGFSGVRVWRLIPGERFFGFLASR